MIGETPEVIYHYTSDTGIMGIVQHGQIWASDIYHLNDAAEVVAGRARLRQLYESDRAVRAHSPSADSFMDRMISGPLAAGASEYDYVMVCSFSAVDDDLSQWRGYTQPGKGYCLGFDFQRLQAALSRKGTLVQVHYTGLDDPPDAAQMQRLIQATTDPMSPTRIKMLQQVDLQLSVGTKHTSFRPEQEWRLWTTRHKRDDDLQFRAGASYLIPYIAITLPLEEVLVECIIGPTPNADLAKTALESLLASKGLTRVSVRVSDSPFRAW